MKAPELHPSAAPAIADPSPVRVILVQGAAARYMPLAKQIAEHLLNFLNNFPYLRDGQGNCGEVAAIAHAVATCAGYEPRLLGGNCLDANGRAPFGRRGGHYWVEMPDGTVIDGAGTNRVQVYRPGDLNLRMIPIVGYRRGAACMRKVKSWLDLSATLQEKIGKSGNYPGLSQMEAAS
ncbi:hypothetical protein [Ciceribacter thiooxidans]|uniref:Transglutaminase-like domain-containing protein n=1 Tax=Ciceribacter thiooxidans TaxID=1969821 RepID=A0ABV7I716_9HYPH|nr:hypothetical protein [Ciceribacter thiooxidans]